MPNDLNEAIGAVSSSLSKSKSAFIREGIIRYLREVNFVGLDEREKESYVTRSGRLVEVCHPPWGLLIGWFLVSFGATSIFLYYCDYFIKL
jgi:hypothetical protein